MNVPGRPDKNWTWRYQDGMIQPEHTAWLADLTAATARWRDPNAVPETPDTPDDADADSPSESEPDAPTQ